MTKQLAISIIVTICHQFDNILTVISTFSVNYTSVLLCYMSSVSESTNLVIQKRLVAGYFMYKIELAENSIKITTNWQN